jgi:glycosyltransferase involved in cell wall biosynthesis
LVARIEGQPGKSSFPMLEWRSPEARAAMHEATVLIGQPARGFRRLRPGQRIIYDLFDPVLLELQEMYGRHPSPRQRIHVLAEKWRLRRALAEGDLLICATSTQRELYGDDGRMIEVPFGAEAGDEGAGTPPRREDLIVWGGGTWEWLDPRTAVEAVVRLNRDGVSCRLLFLGRWRPNRDLVDRRRESRFDLLVASGAPYVFANEQWVPYGERLSWLRRCKIAMMLHRPTSEARYSIRTRLFDAIAATTPVIATEEGFAAELVSQQRLGIVVPPSDVDAVSEAIGRLLRDDVFHAECVSNLERIRPQFAWPVVARPLIEAVSRWQS